MHTADPLVPEASSFKVEIAVEKLKRCKLHGIDQILAELIQAGVIHYVLVSTNLLILFGIRRNCHSMGKNMSLYIFIKWVIKLTSNYRGM
jgi:hypothetical protein